MLKSGFFFRHIQFYLKKMNTKLFPYTKIKTKNLSFYANMYNFFSFFFLVCILISQFCNTQKEEKKSTNRGENVCWKKEKKKIKPGAKIASRAYIFTVAQEKWIFVTKQVLLLRRDILTLLFRHFSLFIIFYFYFVPFVYLRSRRFMSDCTFQIIYLHESHNEH